MEENHPKQMEYSNCAVQRPLAVTDDLKMNLSPVKEPLEIIQAYGTALHILGSAIIFIEPDNLKGRRMLECAVINGNGSRETLDSLEMMKNGGFRFQHSQMKA